MAGLILLTNDNQVSPTYFNCSLSDHRLNTVRYRFSLTVLSFCPFDGKYERAATVYVRNNLHLPFLDLLVLSTISVQNFIPNSLTDVVLGTYFVDFFVRHPS